MGQGGRIALYEGGRHKRNVSAKECTTTLSYCMIAKGPIKKKNNSTVSNCGVPPCVNVSASPNVAASSVAPIVSAPAPSPSVSGALTGSVCLCSA